VRPLQKLVVLGPFGFVACVAAMLFLPMAAWAPTGCNGTCQIKEQTASGYAMKLHDPTGQNWAVLLHCPPGSSEGAGRSLGNSQGFKKPKVGGKFTAKRPGRFTFHGVRDATNHFKGNGTVEKGLCGDAPTHFSEPVPKQAIWTSCPPDDVLNPYPAGTPFTFVGRLPGAALGTHLRIEYTDPSAPDSTDVVHVTTDAAGNFSDTHSFPSDGGSEYGADATARYPDDPLADGVGCQFAIR
jgi:hypothetical protein